MRAELMVSVARTRRCHFLRSDCSTAAIRQERRARDHMVKGGDDEERQAAAAATNDSVDVTPQQMKMGQLTLPKDDGSALTAVRSNRWTSIVGCL